MDLYSYVSIESFVRGCKESKTPGTFTLHVPNLLYAKSDEVTDTVCPASPFDRVA